MKNIIICWAENDDKTFLDTSLSDEWKFDYVQDFKQVGDYLSNNKASMVLVKLQKSNVLNIIRQKKKLQSLQDHFQIPITFFVKHESDWDECSYQILIVDDTEIINVNKKNIEPVLENLINDKFRINKSIYEDKSSHLDGRSYQFAV
jgi:hypothetical protein